MMVTHLMHLDQPHLVFVVFADHTDYHAGMCGGAPLDHTLDNLHDRKEINMACTLQQKIFKGFNFCGYRQSLPIILQV